MAEEQEFIAERKAQLSPLEIRVTQEKVTERPFSNKYNRHWEKGTYHCVVCHTEIFKSDTKFESKSGWPAFSNVVDNGTVDLKPDLSHVGVNLLLLVSRPDLARTEVSCTKCKAHLGHLFKDGPKPTGLRYCVNSTSLSFVPAVSHPGSEGPDGPEQVLPSSSETENKSSNPPPASSSIRSTGGCSGTPGKICFFPSNTNSSINKPEDSPTTSSPTRNSFFRGFGSRKQGQGIVERISSRPSSGILRETSL